MTKQELVQLLKCVNVPVNEGTPEDKKIEVPVRICFWDYIWEPLIASGQEYNTNVTYQISVIAELPRSQELLDLKQKLAEKELYPTIQHEYDVETRRWHSFFSLEVLENV